MPLSTEKPLQYESSAGSREQKEGTQRYDATLPATVIVEREKEPTRTVVEYQQYAPEYSEEHHGAGPGQTFEQSIVQGQHHHREPKVEREHEGLFYRPSERTKDGHRTAESTVPLSALYTSNSDRTVTSNGSVEGVDSSRDYGQRLSEDARLKEQGEHFGGMMEQEIKDERSFQAGRENIRAQIGESPSHHHHHHHSLHHSSYEDERGAGSDRGLSHDSLRPNENLRVQGASGSSNIADTNRRDDNVTSPNPNTTGGQAGSMHTGRDGGATSGKGTTAMTTGLPKEGGTGAVGLPKEGGTTGASTFPKEGAAPDKPKDTAVTDQPGSSLNAERPNMEKDKTGLPKPAVLPADKAPVDAKIDAEKKGSGFVPTTTVPSGKGVPPGSTAPLPPPGALAGSSGGLEKGEEKEEHHGMKGKMHDMKEKVMDVLHIGHHDKDKHKSQDTTAVGGPQLDTHG